MKYKCGNKIELGDIISLTDLSGSITGKVILLIDKNNEGAIYNKKTIYLRDIGGGFLAEFKRIGLVQFLRDDPLLEVSLIRRNHSDTKK